MLLIQLQEMKQFTRNEKDVARYILEHLEDIANMSAEELARASLTSKATVVRLAQKVGLSGYHEFRLKLIAEINQHIRIGQILASEPITSASTYSDIIHTVSGLHDKAITTTRLAFSEQDMCTIERYLHEVECIDIYGTGISYAVAQAAAFKFATLGIESSAYESINGHYLAARKHKKTIAFVISFTGANRSVEMMAKYLRIATNNHVVGILGPYNACTKEWCHEVVEIANRDSLLSLDVITSFAAANYVFDIFFSMLLVRCQEAHVASSLEMMRYRGLLLNDSIQE